MIKNLHVLSIAFAVALIAAAFVIVFAVDDCPSSPSVPRVPSAPTTAPAPVPTVTATTLAPFTVGPVRP